MDSNIYFPFPPSSIVIFLSYKQNCEGMSHLFQIAARYMSPCPIKFNNFQLTTLRIQFILQKKSWKLVAASRVLMDWSKNYGPNFDWYRQKKDSSFQSFFPCLICGMIVIKLRKSHFSKQTLCPFGCHTAAKNISHLMLCLRQTWDDDRNAWNDFLCFVCHRLRFSLTQMQK